MNSGRNGLCPINLKYNKVNLPTFKKMNVAQCSNCGETYARSRSNGKWKFWYLTTTYISGSKQIANKSIFVVPIEFINLHHEHLPLMKKKKKLLT